jgi:hypothetical protein
MSGAPPPGWYPDPWQAAPARWWDGEQWTAHVEDGPGDPETPEGWLVGRSSPSRAQATSSGKPHETDARAAVDREASVARWVRWVVLVPSVLALVSLSATARSLRAALDSGDSPDGIAGPGADGTQLTGLLALAATVGQMVWTYWAVSACRLLGGTPRRTPGLACAGWLIPVLNYWWPYQDVRALFAEGHRPTRHLHWWWALHVLTFPLLVAAVAGKVFAGGNLLVWAPLAVLPPVGSAVLFREVLDLLLASHRQRLAGHSTHPPSSPSRSR